MQIEMIILSKVRKQKTNTIAITYMWNLKYGANEPVYGTETDSQTERTDLWLPWGGGQWKEVLGIWD